MSREIGTPAWLALPNGQKAEKDRVTPLLTGAVPSFSQCGKHLTGEMDVPEIYRGR